jgi:hypothetical protein
MSEPTRPTQNSENFLSILHHLLTFEFERVNDMRTRPLGSYSTPTCFASLYQASHRALLKEDENTKICDKTNNQYRNPF